jgi:hypothetical protein
MATGPHRSAPHHVIPSIPTIHLLTASIICSIDHLFFVSHKIGLNDAHEWQLVQVAFKDSISLCPLCTQDGRFLFKFYICHPSDWRYNAINQRYWLQYHDLLDIQSPHPVLEMNLIRPSDSSASYATRHKLVPFCKWLHISHLDTFIHGPFEFALIRGRKSCDCLAQEDWDQLKWHSTMFGNQIPTFDVPSYSIHVDRGAHEVVLLKASCDDLMSACLGTPESPLDKLYLWQKVTGPTPFLFLQKNEFKTHPLGTNKHQWTFIGCLLHSVGDCVVLPILLSLLSIWMSHWSQPSSAVDSPSSSFMFGPLKGLSPSWLLTRDLRRSLCHLLPEVHHQKCSQPVEPDLPISKE